MSFCLTLWYNFESMRDYELTLVFDPDLTSDEQKNLIVKIKKQVSDAQGEVGKILEWGKKELSYPIKKKTFGLYHFLPLKLPEEAVVGFDKKIKIEEKIIRYLLIKNERSAPAKTPAAKKGKRGTKVTQ